MTSIDRNSISDLSSVFSALSVRERKLYRSFMNNPGEALEGTPTE